MESFDIKICLEATLKNPYRNTDKTDDKIFEEAFNSQLVVQARNQLISEMKIAVIKLLCGEDL